MGELCMITTFDCAADHAIYVAHPLYLEFVNDVLIPIMGGHSSAVLQFAGGRALYKKGFVQEHVTHIVMFSKDPNTTSVQLEALRERVETIKCEIPQIKDIAMFEDLGLESGPKHTQGRNRDVCIMAKFDTAEDYDIYAAHEKHKQMVSDTITPIMVKG